MPTSSPILTIEKNDSLLEGEAEQYVFDWSVEGTPSAATSAVYIENESTDLASVVFTGGVGTCTISGTRATQPLLTARSGDGGKTYIIINAATIGSRIRKCKYRLPIVRLY